MMSILNRNQISGVALGLFALSAVVGFAFTAAIGNRVPLAIALFIGVYLLFSIKIADPWQR